MATLINRLGEFRRSPVFGQLVRFTVVGGLSALLYSAVYLPLAGWLPRGHAVWAVPPAFLVAVAFGYVMHGAWSFRGHGTGERSAGQGAKFVGVQASGMVMNLGWAWVLNGLMGLPAWVPLLPAVFLTPIVTFMINRNWVFG